MTVEPRVEDLLASIRRAIDDDESGQRRTASQPVAANTTSMNEQGKLMRGAMREMRVTVDPTPVRPKRNVTEEIDEIRAKVDRNFAEAASPPPSRQAPANGSFSGIMTGSQGFRPADYPPLRNSIVPEPDFEDAPSPLRYRSDYAPPPPRDQDWDHRPAQNALMSQRATQSAQASFERLAETIMSRLGGDRTIEDMTRELLRGMLRQWLDDNLPTLVEGLVREEIERVARRGR